MGCLFEITSDSVCYAGCLLTEGSFLRLRWTKCVTKGIFKQRMLELTSDRIHYQWGYDRMLVKSLQEIIKTVAEEKSLQPETIMKIGEWLHSLEFLTMKVIMFSLSVYHLYEYTVKNVLWTAVNIVCLPPSEVKLKNLLSTEQNVSGLKLRGAL